MVARDGLSTPAPELVIVLAEGKSSRYVSWGARRVSDVEMIGGRPVAAPHLCPVGRNAHGAVLVRCPCGGVVSRREVSRHAGGRLGRPGGCPCFEAGPLVAAWDEDLRCQVSGCLHGGVPFPGLVGAVERRAREFFL